MTRRRSVRAVEPIRASRPDAIHRIGVGSKYNLLVYGIPGAGKTPLIGTGDNTLIIRPPTDHTSSISPGGRRIEEWVVKTWAEMDEVGVYLRNDALPEDWEWVWFDGVSQFQDHGLDDIWATVLEEKPSRGRYGLDKPEYGVNMFRLSSWIRHLVSMEKYNIGVTAHPTETPDEVGEMLFRPYIQGKGMSSKVCGYMNTIAYLRKEVRSNGKIVRVLYTEGLDEYLVRDQFQALPNGRMVNPTMPKLIAALDTAKAAKLAEQAKHPNKLTVPLPPGVRTKRAVRRGNSA
jgi:hypothetical protein